MIKVTAQVFSSEGPTVITGEPVEIPYAPKDAKFLITQSKDWPHAIFSINTGSWVCGSYSRESAIELATIRFMKASESTDYKIWWHSSCVLFTTYLLYLWVAHERAALSTHPKDCIIKTPFLHRFF